MKFTKLSWREKTFDTEELREDGGTIYRDEDGKFHRNGAPAIISPADGEWWYQHGLLHRDGGPATTSADGVKTWWKRGKRHNEEGPAIVYPYGKEYYALDNVVMDKDEWKSRMASPDTFTEASQKLAWNMDPNLDIEAVGAFKFTAVEALIGRAYETTDIEALKMLEAKLLELIGSLGLSITIDHIAVNEVGEDTVWIIYNLSGKVEEYRKLGEGINSRYRDNDTLYPSYPFLVDMSDEELLDSEASQKLAWKLEDTISISISDGFQIKDMLGYYEFEDMAELNIDEVLTKLKNDLSKIITANNLDIAIPMLSFEDIDSSNLSHAVAYFAYDLYGKPSELRKLIAAINKFYDDNGPDVGVFLPNIEESDITDEDINSVITDSAKLSWKKDFDHINDGLGERGLYREYTDDEGKPHREDGPAYEFENGNKHYYIHGQKLTEEEFNNRNQKLAWQLHPEAAWLGTMKRAFESAAESASEYFNSIDPKDITTYSDGEVVEARIYYGDTILEYPKVNEFRVFVDRIFTSLMVDGEFADLGGLHMYDDKNRNAYVIKRWPGYLTKGSSKEILC